MFNPISEAPLDTLIIFKKVFKDIETPLIVVGEVVTFKGKIHHLYRGGYEETIHLYKQQTKEDWDEKFDSFALL